jgi:hypothetical protein
MHMSSIREIHSASCVGLLDHFDTSQLVYSYKYAHATTCERAAKTFTCKAWHLISSWSWEEIM